MDANVEYIHMRKNKPNKNYKSKNHSKFILTYHIIFTCKYRKKLLIKYGEDVKQIMYDISKRYDFDIKEILKSFNVIHICGKGNLDKELENLEGYRQFEYVKEDLPHFLKAADFVISRAGANVIFELLALKKPTLLIPLSKKISRGDQVLNANSFEKEGYSLVLDEDEMMEKHNLINKLNDLKNRKDELIKNMSKSDAKNGVEAIITVIMNSIDKK